MASYKKIFLKNPYSPVFWLTLGFILKGILFFAVILNHPYQDIQGIWGATQSDDSSYLVPIDNLLQHGIYFPDFRMPGYGAIYLLFRLIFTQTAACNALIVLQLALASASVYYLALISLAIFKNSSAFYITFYLFLVCSFPNFFDAYICTESLCTSLLIFSVYFFIRYFAKQKNRYLFYSGLLATWVLFIRPVFGGLIPIFCILIICHKYYNLNLKIKHIFLFMIPFVLCEGLWIYRNFYIHKKFIPFTTTGSFYPDSATNYLEPLFEFVQSWGGVCSLTQKTVDLDWFQYHYPGLKPITHYDSLPTNIYTSAFNKDSLMVVKRMILALQNPTIDTATASAYQQKLRTKLATYQLSEEKEKPFTYFVKAPLKMMGAMLFSPVTRDYLNRGKSVPLLGNLITTFNYFIYFVILITGLPGAILLIFSLKKWGIYTFIVPFIPLYTILIHPLMFRFFDNRFLMPAFPFLIVCSAYVIGKIIPFSQGKK